MIRADMDVMIDLSARVNSSSYRSSTARSTARANDWLKRALLGSMLWKEGRRDELGAACGCFGAGLRLVLAL